MSLMLLAGCADQITQWVAPAASETAAKPAAAPIQEGGSGGTSSPASPASPNLPPPTAPAAGHQTTGPAGAPAEPATASGAQPARGGLRFELRAGTALPQTGPNGTLMGFSVDYYLVEGSLSGDDRYATCLWTIEGKPGHKLSTKIDPLKPRDNLLLLKDGWRPENGPYRCYFEQETADGGRVVISNVCPLR